jgi:hypothetical protein
VRLSGATGSGVGDVAMIVVATLLRVVVVVYVVA